MIETPLSDPQAAPARASAGFMLARPAHAIALGFGSGLSPKAPGTVGTLWAWVAFLALQPWMTEARWGWLIAGALLLGCWASAVTARDLGLSDPGCIVWDEIAAFWLVLCLVLPAGWAEQLLAFALFRFFDAVKPGPVAWADQLFHAQARSGTAQGWWLAGLGIMLDDVVAAFCTLLVFAVWRAW